MGFDPRQVVRRTPAPVVRRLRQTPIENIYHAILRLSVGTKKVNIKTKYGSFDLNIPEKETLPDGSSYNEQVHEPVLIDALSSKINADSVFYDIGCRYGYFIGVALALQATPENIHGFERHGLSFDILEKNWAERGVNLVNRTVGRGEKTLSLDEYVESQPKPDIIKIDVEGAEFEVLSGATDILTEQPDLFIEVHPEKLGNNGVSQNDIFDILNQHGYGFKWAHHREEDNNDWSSIKMGETPTNEVYLLQATRSE
jgi:precorrin-6B methylase 2